jgi:hypothetical protein
VDDVTPDSRPVDWIAVDDALRHLLGTCEDEQERHAIELAADEVGGPNPRLPLGGQAWQDALARARMTVTTVTTLDLARATLTVPLDMSGLIGGLAARIDEMDTLDHHQRAHLLGLITEFAGDLTVAARNAERLAVAEWLTHRAGGYTGALPVRARGDALRAAAQRLREAIHDPHRPSSDAAA